MHCTVPDEGFRLSDALVYGAGLRMRDTRVRTTKIILSKLVVDPLDRGNGFRILL